MKIIFKNDPVIDFYSQYSSLLPNQLTYIAGETTGGWSRRLVHLTQKKSTLLLVLLVQPEVP